MVSARKQLMPRAMNLISRDCWENRKEISGGVVVFREVTDSREYLLLRHANGGHWSFSKGHLEEGESARDAAVRELTEETGLRPERLLADFRKRVHYSYREEGAKIEKAVVYFLAFVDQFTSVSLSEEHLDYEWTPFGKAVNKLTYDNDVEILKKAEEKLESHGY